VCTLAENRIDNSFVFVENTNARIFKTIELKNKDLDHSLLKIDKVISKLPKNSFVRIKAKKDHAVYLAFEELKLKYCFYFLTKTSLEDEEEQYLIIKNNIVST
jgi:hypothetical protein